MGEVRRRPHHSPLPAAEVRRRGDRRRRRRTGAWGAAAIVTAIGCSSMVIGALPGVEGVDDQQRYATTDGTDGTDGTEDTEDTGTTDGVQGAWHAAVSDDELLAAEDLPPRSAGFAEWVSEDPLTHEYTLGCQPGRLRELLPIVSDGYTEFTATFRAGDGPADPASADVRDAAINSGLLRFADATTARAAYDTVRRWLLECVSIAGSPTAVSVADAEVSDLSADAEGTWWSYEYAFPAACASDCDAVRDHAMGAALVGTDVVLLSHAQTRTDEQSRPVEEIAALLAAAAERAGT